MPHAKPDDLPCAGDRWPLSKGRFRSVHWGDLEIGLTTIGPSDFSQAYKNGGFPGGVCSCPHYGYLFEGRIICRFPDTDIPDEVVEAGEVFYFPAGHVLIYEQTTRCLELNPASALQDCMNRMQVARAKQIASEA